MDDWWILTITRDTPAEVADLDRDRARRRDARGAVLGKPEKLEPEEVLVPAQVVFDTLAYEATAGAVLFHFGAPLWMWIFA